MKKKILITDDSKFIRMVLKEYLNKNFDVVEADGGASAVRQFSKESPDLVLLDVIMPKGEEEGIKTLKQIIKINPEAKVIMITAVGQNSVIKECKDIGATDYIIKPFDEDQVLKTICKYI